MKIWDGRADAATAAAVLPLGRLVTEMEILGALRFDGSGRVVGCNSTMAQLLGASAGEISGATLREVLDAPDAAAMLALVRSGREHLAGRVRLSFLDRARQPLVLECAVALDRSGGAVLASRPQNGRDGTS